MKQIVTFNKAMDIYKLAWTLFLLCISIALVSSNILQSDSVPDDIRQETDLYRHSNFDGHSNTDMDMDDIFQYRVEDASQLCPKKYMLLFLLTRDSKYLRECGYAAGVSKTRTNSNGQKPFAASYSGNILKRILDNMDAGTAKIDFQEGVKGESEKRARLSINGALSSLADMLRHESRRHRRPQFAFHREMLNMG